MTPFFAPVRSRRVPPAVFLAAVGEGMTRVAGEVADGMLVHGLHHRTLLREVTQPTIEAALASTGRRRADFQLSYPAFVVTAVTPTSRWPPRRSRPENDRLLRVDAAPIGRSCELHGWGELQTVLLQSPFQTRGMGRDGPADRRRDVDAFAVTGSPQEVPGLLEKRFGDVIDRLSLYMPYGSGDLASRILSGLRRVPSK